MRLRPSRKIPSGKVGRDEDQDPQNASRECLEKVPHGCPPLNIEEEKVHQKVVLTKPTGAAMRVTHLAYCRTFHQRGQVLRQVLGDRLGRKNTQLTRRLAKEGRLHVNHEIAATTGGDQCSAGLNFDTLRPLRAVLEDYKRVLDIIYQPDAYAARLKRLASLLDRSGSNCSVPTGDLRGSVCAMELVHRIVYARPETRELFWQVFMTCARENPNATRIIVGLMALYLHLGPFSRRVIAEIDRRIAADVAVANG
jgi:Domain of unknown function (DUF4070)